MAFTWSGGADFADTFPGTGASTDWFLDILTIPPGKVSVPRTGSILYVGVALLENPGGDDTVIGSPLGTPAAGAGTVDLMFVDSGGIEYSGSGTLNPDLSFAYVQGADSPGGALFGPVTYLDRNMGPSGFTGGGTLRLRGYFSDAVGSETITGTVVAAIYDSSITTQRTRISNGGTTNTPVLGTAFFANDSNQFYGDWDHGVGVVVGHSPATATAPTFEGALNWVDLVSQTNGNFFAAIGDYVGLPGSPSFRIDYPPFPTGGVKHWQIDRIQHTADVIVPCTSVSTNGVVSGVQSLFLNGVVVDGFAATFRVTMTNLAQSGANSVEYKIHSQHDTGGTAPGHLVDVRNDTYILAPNQTRIEVLTVISGTDFIVPQITGQGDPGSTSASCTIDVFCTDGGVITQSMLVLGGAHFAHAARAGRSFGMVV